MVEKKECKIVKDLLPNYIEKLTSDETNEFIEKHIEECEECKESLEKMQKHFESDSKENNVEEVKYIKKYRNKLNLLKLIVSIIVIIYILNVARNVIILANLNIKANSIANYENYYEKSSAYYGDGKTSNFELYKNGKDFYRVWHIHLRNDQNAKIITYKKGNEYIEVVENEEGKKTNKLIENYENDDEIKIMENICFSTGDLLHNIKLALFSKIETRNCNGKTCYVIKDGGLQKYFDKNTGIAVRTIDDDLTNTNGRTSNVGDIEYKFNTVTDEDIKRPDITDAIH